ncbi:MAG: sulfatase-like hydrolase/transferase [Verrucomicrobiales bacterium]|nr:sulfatase-like hydrolase/transferase [Verrucomicrobiales bacterium]
MKFLLLFSACLSGAFALADERPNLLFIMTDDQGYWDTGATGNPHIDTPHIDSLAIEGTQFRRYYAAPVCAPTRAGVMTGRYYLRTGLYNTRFGGDSMGTGETTMAQLLKQAGYRTGLFGKWHLGKYPGYQPQERGFDEFFGHYHGHIERYEFPDQVYHNGTAVEARGYVSDLFADASIDFIEATATATDDPFFCALMFNAPHSPWLLDTSHYAQPEGDKILEKYLKRGLPIREARIYSLIERVDDNVGKVLAKLEDLGLAENTLVIFTSDNGGVSKFWKGGMNGNKAGTYEGGVRAPFFARWKGTVPPGGVVEGQVSHVDLLPTFCELAGAELPADLVLDGKSLVPLLEAGEGGTHHEYVYHTWDRYFPNPDRRWAVSDQRWKLMAQFGSDATPSPSGWRLFDLESDPGEKKNLIQKEPEVAERLRREFVRWFDEVTDGITYAPIRIPVGHPGEDPVEIEPSWASWEGDHINYTFDGYDWDTIDGWKDPGETATWRLDVVEAGTYTVKLSYGCRPLDAGGLLRVSSGDSMIEHTVQATTTAEQFGLFDAGTIELNKGEVGMTAEVVSAPGLELMRLNGIHLERVK